MLTTWWQRFEPNWFVAVQGNEATLDSRPGDGGDVAEDREERRSERRAATMTSLLPPPKPLDMASEPWNAWKKWLMEFELFAVATHLMDQPDKVQAATLLVCIGEEGRRIYTTFTFVVREVDRCAHWS